jgi:hypothetical protein
MGVGVASLSACLARGVVFARQSEIRLGVFYNQRIGDFITEQEENHVL